MDGEGRGGERERKKRINAWVGERGNGKSFQERKKEGTCNHTTSGRRRGGGATENEGRDEERRGKETASGDKGGTCTEMNQMMIVE